MGGAITIELSRYSDRRCGAPKGGAIKIELSRYSDRRCGAPKGGAIKIELSRYSDRRCGAPKGGAIKIELEMHNGPLTLGGPLAFVATATKSGAGAQRSLQLDLSSTSRLL